MNRLINFAFPATRSLSLVLLLLVLSSCAAVSAARAEERAVRVGVYDNAPKISIDPSGKPVGLFIDLLEYIAGQEGWRLHYVPGTWAENLERLEQGQIDILPDMAFSAERAERYAFHKVPVLSSWFQVYAPKDSGIHSLLDLNGKRVLVLDGSVQESALARLSQGFGLSPVLVRVSDYQTMFTLVARGEADAGVTNRFYGKRHARQHGLEDTAVIFEPSDLYYATAKGDPKRLLGSIDRQLTGLKRDHGSVYHASLKRWISEEVRFRVPFWLWVSAMVMAGILVASLVAGAILKHQVKTRTRELKASEREYRELLMLANSIILRWTPDGRVTFLNEFGQRFFGYSAEEILGRPLIGTIVPESEIRGRDLRALIREISLDPSKYERNVNENMRRNGDRVWIDWANRMVPDDQGGIREILSIGSDVTERRQAEEQIRRLNEELRGYAETLERRVAERTAELAAINEEQQAVLDSASTGIVLLRDRVIHRCNRKLEEIAGYGPGELVGRSTRIWYDDEAAYQAGGEEIYARLSRGETYRVEQRMQRQDGTRFWARLSLRALNGAVPAKGAVGIIEDITAEHEAAERLRQALAAAQEADRIKSAFLATMSHELRTPLNSIIGFTGIMLQGLTGPLNPEQHKQMGMVQKSARHLLALINDVLDISKIEAGQLQLAPIEFELGPSIEKTARLIAPLVEQKGLELGVDVAGEVGTIFADQRRFEQMLLNLLSNAVKFTESGRVAVTCSVEGDQYLIAVTDTGMGIQAEELPRLFQPFHQIDTGLARKHEGTGLGLSICRKLVDMMDGSIEVRSEWGRGSTFAVRLPRHRGETG